MNKKRPRRPIIYEVDGITDAAHQDRVLARSYSDHIGDFRRCHAGLPASGRMSREDKSHILSHNRVVEGIQNQHVFFVLSGRVDWRVGDAAPWSGGGPTTRDVAVQSRDADTEASGHFTYRDGPILQHRLRCADVIFRHHTRAPADPAMRTSAFNTGPHALTQILTFEFRHARDDMEEESTGWAFCVDLFRQRPELDAALFQLIDRLDELPGASGKSVELEHHEFVARTQHTEEFSENGTVNTRTGSGFFKNLVASSCDKHVAL